MNEGERRRILLFAGIAAAVCFFVIAALLNAWINNSMDAGQPPPEPSSSAKTISMSETVVLSKTSSLLQAGQKDAVAKDGQAVIAVQAPNNLIDQGKPSEKPPAPVEQAVTTQTDFFLQ